MQTPIPRVEDLTFASLHDSLSVLSNQLAQQATLRDQVKSEIMQEVKDRPTFSEMIQFFFDKAKGMSTQPPFLSVHIEAVRRVTSVLESKFEETLAVIQKTANEQTEHVMRAAALVDNAHEGMVSAVRKLSRKTERQGRLLKGVVRAHIRRGNLTKLFGAWRQVADRSKLAATTLRRLAHERQAKVMTHSLRTWKQRALLLLTKENSAAIAHLESATETCAERLAEIEAKVDTLCDSKASTAALKQVQHIAEQRDYSSFLKDVFEYVSVQVKELSEGMEGSKEYIDQQCRKVLSIVKDRMESTDHGRTDDKLHFLERTIEALRLQHTLLGERLNKFDFLVNVEDAEFKVAVLNQQLAKVEVGMERLQSSLYERLAAPSPPAVPSKRPSTVSAARPFTRKTAPKPFSDASVASLSSQPNHTVSLILGGESRMSPTQPMRARINASVRSELPTPPQTAGGTVESTPVSTRSKTQHSRGEDGKRRSGRVRSGKPFADMKMHNKKVLDEMVIFNSKAFRQEL